MEKYCSVVNLGSQNPPNVPHVKLRLLHKHFIFFLPKLSNPSQLFFPISSPLSSSPPPTVLHHHLPPHHHRHQPAFPISLRHHHLPHSQFFSSKLLKLSRCPSLSPFNRIPPDSSAHVHQIWWMECVHRPFRQ